MKPAPSRGSSLSFLLLISLLLLSASTIFAAEPLPLKRAVELALAHGTVSAAGSG